jgi:hypothetical protein
MNIKIIVAAHKSYWMPSDPMYLPLHVGAEGKQSLGYSGDNTGDNISLKNPNYCELTGLYWAWKNLQADYIGLVHYRRHFTVTGAKGSKQERVITQPQMEAVLNKTDVVLPKPRNYFIETNYSQYAHAHHAEDLDTTRAILEERYPQYLAAYDSVMQKTVGHRFNMFVMKKDKFDSYCQWLFAVLFELERRLDISQYSKNDVRVFGFVSERLLDVWLETNHVSYQELPYIFMEKQNWIVKGMNFLKRKFVSHK